MIDPRLKQLSHSLVNYSLCVKKGERVLIECTGEQREFITQLIAEVYQAGGQPFVNIRDTAVTRALLLGADKKQIEFWARYDCVQMDGMDCYLGIRAGENSSELSDVPAENLRLYARQYTEPVHMHRRIPNTRWAVLRYPTPSMAQMANSSTAAFEDFYFNVCNLDYAKMSKAMDPLVELMEKTDKVHIKGPGTDLTFSIKGIPVIKCDGKLNIPDGEVFTAPVKDSVNGTLQYNTPSLQEGFTYENIRFVFNNGKIVDATSNDNERINKLLDVDEGARYVGEFAIGVNPFITTAMKDTLFDEKIRGSFHFTPGSCYDDAPNGNKSANHWDLVCIQTAECGGGEIWFDDRLIRKDGLFVVPELEPLNPENLM